MEEEQDGWTEVQKGKKKKKNVNAKDSNLEMSEQKFKCKGGKNTCGCIIDQSVQSIVCNGCGGWFHPACQELQIGALKALSKYDLIWLCMECKNKLPFMMEIGKLVDKRVSEAEIRITEAVHETKIATEENKSGHRTMIQHLEDKISSFETLAATAVEQRYDLMNKITELGVMVNAQYSKPDPLEMKSSFADVVKGSCDKVITALSTKIEAMPQESGEDLLDRERRKCNIVVHNLPESDSASRKEAEAHDCRLLESIFKNIMFLNVRIVSSFRIGQRNGYRPRLLIAALESEATKWDVVRNARELQRSQEWGQVYINPDQTKAEREKAKKLREELARRRQAGEKDIVIRKGKIVSVPGSDNNYEERRKARELSLRQPRTAEPASRNSSMMQARDTVAHNALRHPSLRQHAGNEGQVAALAQCSTASGNQAQGQAEQDAALSSRNATLEDTAACTVAPRQLGRQDVFHTGSHACASSERSHD